MTSTLGSLELMMMRVEGTLRSVEGTLQSSFTLQEKYLQRQTDIFELLQASAAQQEKTQADILRLLQTSAT
jgi:hypothetical protein